MNRHQRIGLGGGCHWCTEGVFVSLDGVVGVEQGFISAAPPDHSFSEAVIVHFDPKVIGLHELLRVHVETHSASGDHGLRGRYRSAVYALDEGQRRRCEHMLSSIREDDLPGLLTRALRFGEFRSSLPEHQDYYRTDPSRPFCRRYIAPKIDRLRADRPHLFFNHKQ